MVTKYPMPPIKVMRIAPKRVSPQRMYMALVRPILSESQAMMSRPAAFVIPVKETQAIAISTLSPRTMPRSLISGTQRFHVPLIKKIEKNSAQNAGSLIAWPRVKLTLLETAFAGSFRFARYSSPGSETKRQAAKPRIANTMPSVKNTGTKFTTPASFIFAFIRAFDTGVNTTVLSPKAPQARPEASPLLCGSHF